MSTEFERAQWETQRQELLRFLREETEPCEGHGILARDLLSKFNGWRARQGSGANRWTETRLGRRMTEVGWLVGIWHRRTARGIVYMGRILRTTQ